MSTKKKQRREATCFAALMLAVTWLNHSAADEASKADLAQANATASPPPNLHLFLLAGQSNMAGRGKPSAEDQQPHPRVWTVSPDQTWVPAADPIHFDKPSLVGVGPGKTFGVLYAEAHPDAHVGLIPCAVGGSSITTWVPDGFHEPTQLHPYDDCVQRVRWALQFGELKGILWHQGESDSNPKNAADYQANLDELIERFRTEFKTPKIPFIAGQLGQFEERPWNKHRLLVNEAHKTLPDRIENTGFVASDGLGHKGDQTHFSAEAAREFGRRYWSTYQELTNDD
ncbi:sialate O-acetylesterase [Rhodopirellula sp. JC740]|uniref:Sialate O-acetylesterase n=1 Tax=Rhodopirellula halodulae TaxID=2894198 RepID=A0ABS8NEG7_9BACT|nr:sialate O-acetylesterase [Rhodopirellula sp. JC740]MCC9641939.1 sialate O-acetylesterase [Rhodopirellula sp. JC740]